MGNRQSTTTADQTSANIPDIAKANPMNDDILMNVIHCCNLVQLKEKLGEIKRLHPTYEIPRLAYRDVRSDELGKVFYLIEQGIMDRDYAQMLFLTKTPDKCIEFIIKNKHKIPLQQVVEKMMEYAIEHRLHYILVPQGHGYRQVLRGYPFIEKLCALLNLMVLFRRHIQPFDAEFDFIPAISDLDLTLHEHILSHVFHCLSGFGYNLEKCLRAYPNLGTSSFLSLARYAGVQLNAREIEFILKNFSTEGYLLDIFPQMQAHFSESHVQILAEMHEQCWITDLCLDELISQATTTHRTKALFDRYQL